MITAAAKEARLEAETELKEERLIENKNRFKDLLGKIERSKKVTANFERELEELEIELS